MSIGSPDTPKGYNELQEENAAISREQYDDFLNRFGGIQESLTKDAYNPGKVTQVASDDATRAFTDSNRAADSAMRTRKRLGVKLDADQEKFVNKQNTLNAQKNSVGAFNQSTMGESERQDSLRNTMMGINRGQANEALGEFNTAAGMENQAGIGEMQRQNQKYAQNMSAYSTMAGLGMMAIMSSKDAKKKIKPLDRKKAAKEMNEMDLKNYEYKDGMGMPGKRTGAIAEEMPESMTTPDGKMVKLADWNAKNTAAIQVVNQKLDGLDKSIRSLKRKRA